MLKISAIVPVYNPGSNIDECIESLVGQSLPADEYEAIFVDDGSTDGTAERLDELAARVPNVRVEHIPNSGWPGRPRNVGIDMARGEFVYFVDNDDHLGREALERLYERATTAGADIVIGKVVGRGKKVSRWLFRLDRESVTLRWGPLLSLLTPHKLFRRAMLEENAIRFPEGRRRLEDHVFVMHAYFHARRISVLADYPCYYWVLRDDGSANASYSGIEPEPYYRDLREVLDLVDEHTEPGDLRDQLLTHWFRTKMLGRVGGRYFPRRTPEMRRALHTEVADLTRERFGPHFDELLPWNLRVRAHLLREGTLEALERLAEMEAEVRPEALVQRVRREPDGTYVIDYEARQLGEGGRPLAFRRDGEALRWVPPQATAAYLTPDVLEATAGAREPSVQVTIRSQADGSEYVLPGRHEARLEPTGAGLVTPVVTGEARIESGRAAAGAAPAAGRWEVLAAVNVCGFGAVTRMRDAATGVPHTVLIDGSGAVSGRTRARLVEPAALAALAARRLPRVAGVLRRARSRRGTPATL